MLPQVVVLVAAGPFVSRFVDRVGLERASWLSAVGVVVGLAVYATLSNVGYLWVAVALVLEAASMRVIGVVAGVNVLRGLPEDRSTIGAALVDTASQVMTGAGIAVTGIILAGFFTGAITTPGWTPQQDAQFREAVTVAGLVLTVVAALLVGWASLRIRRHSNEEDSASISDAAAGQL